jgi:hypothetical protein
MSVSPPASGVKLKTSKNADTAVRAINAVILVRRMVELLFGLVFYGLPAPKAFGVETSGDVIFAFFIRECGNVSRFIFGYGKSWLRQIMSQSVSRRFRERVGNFLTADYADVADGKGRKSECRNPKSETNSKPQMME